MYLPKSKYKEPKYTQGYEFGYANRKPYIGWYFETYKQEYYTGKEPSDNSKRIFRLDTNSTTEQGINFTPQIITPTAEDRLAGVFKRYFVQNRNTLKVIEVKKDKYDLFFNIKYLKRVELDWVLKKPAEDVVINGYKYEGASTRNRRAVEKAEQTISNLKNYIKSYDEFVE